VFFMYAPATRVIYSLSLHDALPILAVDSTGVETKIPMDDWIEIGIFAPAKEGEKKREILYKKMHHLDAETKTIIVNVSNEPGTGAIDPYYLLNDWRMDDNLLEIIIEE